MNKDQVKGHIDEAKGAVKEIAGKLVGNEDLEQEGTIQEAMGLTHKTAPADEDTAEPAATA